jgi:hypothetical protein
MRFRSGVVVPFWLVAHGEAGLAAVADGVCEAGHTPESARALRPAWTSRQSRPR